MKITKEVKFTVKGSSRVFNCEKDATAYAAYLALMFLGSKLIAHEAEEVTDEEIEMTLAFKLLMDNTAKQAVRTLKDFIDLPI